MFPGVDIIEIERFQRSCARQGKLLQRLFTQRELLALEGKHPSSYAARFAGKEAVLKALGTGLRGLSWHDLEILSDPLGQPRVILSTRAEQLVLDKGGRGIRLSLSHCKEYAIAMAILHN